MLESQADIPEFVGPFPVVRALASGGMASVFEVEDPGTGRRMALKLLTRPGLALPRFDREYRALTRLDHPNIIRVYQFGISDAGQRYLTMELVDGEPTQVFAKGLGRPGTPNRTQRVMEVTMEIAKALGYLHERGLVHRDLKSSNVLVDESGRVKLLDFGTARLLTPEDEITRHGEFVGTFAYASPEQLRGEAVDARTDLYSLGVLLYRMLTGKRPFNADSPHDLAKLHLDKTPTDPAAVVSGISDQLSSLVMGLLQKEASARPATAWVVIERLESLIGVSSDGARGQTPLSAGACVGRDTEVQSVRRFVHAMVPGSLAVVRGAVGSGRMRFVAQVEAIARQQKRDVFVGSFRGLGGAGGVVAVGRELARGLPTTEGSLRDEDLRALAKLSMGQPIHQLESLVDVFVSLIRRRLAFSDRGALLVFRDVERASPFALNLMSSAFEKVRQSGLAALFLCTSLDGDGVMSELGEVELDIRLGSLGPTEVGRLVGALLGRRAPPASLARRLYHGTGGMPGDIVEVLHQMVRSGYVVASAPQTGRLVWRDRSGGRLDAPPRVRRRISIRVDALTESERRLLDVLVVADMPLARDVLACAAEVAPTEADVGLEALCSTGLVSQSAGRFRPRTGLISQQVRDQIGVARSAVLTDVLADVVGAGPASLDTLRLFIRAGRWVAAASLAVGLVPAALLDARPEDVVPIVARLCEALEPLVGSAIEPSTFSDVALLMLTSASMVREVSDDDLRLLERLPPSSDGVAAVRLTGARLYRLRGTLDRANEEARGARQALLAQPSSDVSRALHEECGRLALVTGEPERALQEFQAAERGAAAAGLPDRELQARVGQARTRFALGDLDGATSDLRLVRARAERSGVPAVGLHAGTALARVLRQQGRHSEAIELLDADLDEARVGFRPLLRTAALLERANLSLDLFRLGEVRDLIDEIEGIEISAGHPALGAGLVHVLSRLHFADGEPDRALQLLEPSCQRLASVGLPVERARLQGWLGEALVVVGQRDRGQVLIDEATDALVRLKHIPVLAEVCARRVSAGLASAEVGYAPVSEWLSASTARLARWQRAAYGLPTETAVVSTQALLAIEQMELAMAEFEARLGLRHASALRVHPWTRRLERVRTQARAVPNQTS